MSDKFLAATAYRYPAGEPVFGEVAELAESARLLSGYTVTNCIEGSNPSLSANPVAQAFGGVAERSKATVLKTVDR